MINPNTPAAEQLRREGLRALHERLGVAGAVRFLREFNRGHGDYTAERPEWVDEWSVEEIEAAIRQAQSDEQGQNG